MYIVIYNMICDNNNENIKLLYWCDVMMIV